MTTYEMCALNVRHGKGKSNGFDCIQSDFSYYCNSFALWVTSFVTFKPVQMSRSAIYDCPKDECSFLYGPIDYGPIEYGTIEYEPIEYGPIECEPIEYEPIEIEIKRLTQYYWAEIFYFICFYLNVAVSCR